MKKNIFGKIRIIFSSIVMAILLLLELYIMINDPKNYVMLVLISLVLLLALYILVSVVISKIHYDQQLRHEEIENIIKTEKAFYLMLRKSFSDLHNKITDIENRIIPLSNSMKNNEKVTDKMLEKLVQEQKKVAKITIGRAKENSDALINSNDKLKEKIFDFDKKLDIIKEDIIEKQSNAFNQEIGIFQDKQLSFLTQEVGKFEEIQRELLSLVGQLELSIKNQLLESTNKILSHQPQVIMNPSQVASYTEPVVHIVSNKEEPRPVMEEATIEEPVMEEPVLEEPELVMEEPVLEELEPVMEEPVLEEPELVMEEPVLEELEPVMEEPVLEEPEPVVKEPIIEEPVMEESMLEEEILEEPVMEEPIIEEPIIEEPIMEESKPEMPDLSDPNKMMSAEDIAALIANM